MNFAILGLLVVLVIAFFVVVWKAAKDWRWYNIVAVCIIMLLAIAFLFPTAGVLASRSAWHKIKEELEVQAASVEVENHLIKYGDPANPEAGEGVIVLDQKLSKLGIEAGRRWRNLQLQNVANNNITLQGVAPQPQIEGVPDEPAADAAAPADGEAAPPAAAPAAPAVLIPESLVVYGFAETRETVNQQQILIPTFYLGEFRVTASTADQVTLAPTGPLEPSQLQAISTRQAIHWTLYESLPLDGHYPFIAEGSVSSDENFFGRVDDDLVHQRMDNKVTPETLQDYLRDGSRATDDDAPLSRWTKIQFTKNHAIEVDSPEQRGALDGGFFDGNGRAVDGRLQRGEDGKVKFKKGDQILVKEEVANELIDVENVASLVADYYLRPLNDYRYILRRIRLRLTELANRMTELQFEQKVLEVAIEKTNGMLVANQDIKLKLEQDFAQFRIEKVAIDDYASKAREGVKKMRAEMIRLHRENLALEEKLEKMHLATVRRLDALTAGK